MDVGFRVRVPQAGLPSFAGDGAHARRATASGSMPTTMPTTCLRRPREWADIVARVNVKPARHRCRSPRSSVRDPDLAVSRDAYVHALAMIRGGANRANGPPSTSGSRESPVSGSMRTFPGRPMLPTCSAARARWAGQHEQVTRPRLRFAEALQRALDRRRRPGLRRTDRPGHVPARRRFARRLRSTTRRPTDASAGSSASSSRSERRSSLCRFDNPLPSPLVHGTHVHYVEDDVDAMRHTILLLTSDHDYRRHLELGARSWFDANMTPTSCRRAAWSTRT